MSFEDPFGGSTVQPGDVSFRAITLAASIVLEWPALSVADQPFARIMDATSSNAAFTITLPPALNVSPGQDCLVTNRGGVNVSVLNNAGANLATLTPGQSRYFYLTDNSTAAGVWTSMLFGAASATIDASQLAGRGLQARGLLLDTGVVTTFVAVSRSLADTDRASLVVWNGGGGTLTLPDNAALASFYCEVRNAGTGPLVLAAFGGQTLDGVASVSLVPGESTFVHIAQGVAAYTVGRKPQLVLTRETFAGTGGTRVLTLVESSNVVQNYTGVLVSNQIIEFPAVVQTYYVSNNTSGAFTLTFKTSGAGAAVVVPTGQNAILVCTGTDVVNASTTAAGIAALVLGLGSASNPSLAVGAANNGIYAPSSTLVGISAGGVLAFTVGQLGASATAVGAAALSSNSSGSNATLAANASSGFFKRLAFQTAGLLRWTFESNNVAESGADAGSNFVLRNHNDTGGAITDVVTVTRSTGAVAIPGASTLGSLAVTTNATVGGALTATGGVVLGANMNAAGFKAVSLAAGANPGESVRFEQLFSQGAPLDIVAGATTDIGASNSTFLRATGAGPTTVNSFGTNYNGPRYVTFVGEATLTYNATTMVTPGNISLPVAAGSTVLAVPKATSSGTPDGWRIVQSGVSPTQTQTNPFTSFLSTGTGLAYTLAPSPAIIGYTDNLQFNVRFHAASQAGATLNVNALGPKALMVYGPTGALEAVGTEITVGFRSRVTYNGTEFILRDRPTRSPAFYVQSSANTTSGLTESNSYSTPVINRGGAFDAATGRFTAPFAGVYAFSVTVQANANAASIINAFVRKGGVGPNYGSVAVIGSASLNVMAGGVALVEMSAGEYVSAWQNVSGGLSANIFVFSGHFVG